MIVSLLLYDLEVYEVQPSSQDSLFLRIAHSPLHHQALHEDSQPTFRFLLTFFAEVPLEIDVPAVADWSGVGGDAEAAVLAGARQGAGVEARGADALENKR